MDTVDHQEHVPDNTNLLIIQFFPTLQHMHNYY